MQGQIGLSQPLFLAYRSKDSQNFERTSSHELQVCFFRKERKQLPMATQNKGKKIGASELQYLELSVISGVAALK